MPDASMARGLAVVLVAYAAGAAWYWLNLGLPPATSAELTGAGLIAFMLPTAAAVLLWLFYAIETRRPICAREPGDGAATERILFRILVFIAGLHALVLLLVTEVRWVRNWGLQLAFLLIGALLVSVGNLLPQTRPNVFVGIRTPRSLRSRHFWMEINRAGGYVSVALGLVMMSPLSCSAIRWPQRSHSRRYSRPSGFSSDGTSRSSAPPNRPEPAESPR